MASAEYRVLTPERVSLQYDIAGVGSRGAAAIVDSLIQGAVLGVAFITLSAVLVAGALVRLSGDGAVMLIVGVLAFTIFVVASGYHMLFEILWSGQTPGKRMVGVRVIRENGYPLRPVDAVIRNLVRIVDWLPAVYGVGVLTMLLNTRSKRLGDFAAGTIVVREGSRGPVGVLLPVATESRGYTLSNADATLVRDFLVRRASMHPQARAALAGRLAAALSRRYGLTLDAEAERFLEELAA